MSKPLVLPTIWGNHVRARQAYDHDGVISGVGVDFLESDPRHVRDMETLERADALMLGVRLCELALSGLPEPQVLAVWEDTMQKISDGGPSNVFPFPHVSPGTSFRPADHPAGGGAHTPPAGNGAVDR